MFDSVHCFYTVLLLHKWLNLGPFLSSFLTCEGTKTGVDWGLFHATMNEFGVFGIPTVVLLMLLCTSAKLMVAVRYPLERLSVLPLVT